MSNFFDRVAREEIRKRGDQFIAAAKNFADAANTLTVSLNKLVVLAEQGKINLSSATAISGLGAADMKNLASKTDEVGKSFNNFSKALKEFS
jgi:aspartate-semialdehyde dehydrogenase